MTQIITDKKSKTSAEISPETSGSVSSLPLPAGRRVLLNLLNGDLSCTHIRTEEYEENNF